MRHPIPLLATPTLVAALLLAGCAEKKTEDAAASAEAPAQESATSPRDETGPGLSRAVAPGVAFTYEYAFTLPASAISRIQRQHAQACAQLGPDRCRVTGMNYDQPSENRIAARTDFLLAPDVAQAFASGGIEAVEAAKGKLDNARINGANAGDDIKLSQSDSAAVEAEAKRIEARLAAPGLAASERAELQRQLGELRERLRGNAQDRGRLERSIATTPVSFAYDSEGLVGGQGTFGKALGASWDSTQTFLGVLMLVLGLALPWLAFGGALVLAWRWLKRRTASPVKPVASSD